MLCALALFSFMNTSNAAINIEVIPSLAPFGPTSPSWNGYVTNALAGIDAGGAAQGAGTRDSNPARYENVNGVLLAPEELVFTPNFNSWRGTAANNPVFTGNAAVAGELGNRIHFGTKITATGGMSFALNDVSWELDSSDLGDYFDLAGTFAGASYSPTRIGTNYGGDGAKGGGDDTVYTSGAGTNVVHELLYVGVGTGFDSDNTGALTDQEDINSTLAAVYSGCNGCDVILKGSYSVGGETGVTSVTIFVPEPSSLLLASLGMFACLGMIRRKRS